jgi:hypothetical protein
MARDQPIQRCTGRHVRLFLKCSIGMLPIATIIVLSQYRRPHALVRYSASPAEESPSSEEGGEGGSAPSSEG